MSISVFIADDHAIVRDGLKSLLSEEADLEVTGEAADGREAVRLMKHFQSDIAIIDIAMPELNGIDVTREILASCPSSRVIILSMYSTDEHIFLALQAGASGYLLKESAGGEVIRAIRVVNAGHIYMSSKIPGNILLEYRRREQSSNVLSPIASLSFREREILQYVVEGRTSAEIAALLELSVKTVESYRSRMMTKLGVKNIPALVKFAIQHGITPLT